MTDAVVVCCSAYCRFLVDKQAKASWRREEVLCAVYSGRSPSMTFNKTCYYRILSKARARCESSKRGNPRLKKMFVRKIEGTGTEVSTHNKTNKGGELVALSECLYTIF